jgi:hypothetical protein
MRGAQLYLELLEHKSHAVTRFFVAGRRGYAHSGHSSLKSSFRLCAYMFKSHIPFTVSAIACPRIPLS